MNGYVMAHQLDGLSRMASSAAQKWSWDSWLRLPATLSREHAALLNLVLILLASAIGGLMIFAFCRYYYRGVPIMNNLDSSLIPASVLSTLIFYQSGGLPGLSILLVAVLGFIHFRSVIKDFIDVSFVFWSIISGLLIGAGYPLPVLLVDGLIVLAGLLLTNHRSSRLIYLLIIRYDPQIANQLMQILQPLHGKIRSQFAKNGLIDLTIEVRLRYISLAIVDRIAAMEGVHNAVMVSNDGNPGF